MTTESSLTALEFDPRSIKLGESYLLTGGDAYLTDLVLDAIRGKLIKSDDMDLFIIYGDEVSAADLNEQLDTLSIFSRAKLLIIRNAHKLEKKKLDALSSYFQSPSEIQTLAIVAEKIDARLSTWKTIKNGCVSILCNPPKFAGELRAWLDNSLKTYKKNMTSKAKEEFINRIELDFAFAANELTKLDILTGTRETISEADVYKSLSTTRTGAVIDFYRALGKKQLQSSLEAVNKMLVSDWEPLQVFFQITKFYTLIWRIQVLRNAHFAVSEIMGKHLNDLFQSQRKEFVDFAQRYPLETLEDIMPILLETDSQIKLSMADPGILLTSCLMKVLYL